MCPLFARITNVTPYFLIFISCGNFLYINPISIPNSSLSTSIKSYAFRTALKQTQLQYLFPCCIIYYSSEFISKSWCVLRDATIAYTEMFLFVHFISFSSNHFYSSIHAAEFPSSLSPPPRLIFPISSFLAMCELPLHYNGRTAVFQVSP